MVEDGKGRTCEEGREGAEMEKETGAGGEHCILHNGGTNFFVSILNWLKVLSLLHLKRKNISLYSICNIEYI